MVAVMLGFTSCSDDDDELPRIEEPTGSFTLPDQPLDEEMVFVEDLSISKDGWIVVRRDNGDNEPLMTEIISMPEYVEAGDYDEVSIRLKNNTELVEGERLWVNLHVDDGDMVFEYSASNQSDTPVLNSSGSLVAHSFMVDMPDPTGSLSAEDQELDQNRKLNISSVVNSHPGWVVVYHDAEEGPDLNVRLSVPRHIEAGTHTDLKVDLEDDVDIQNNQLLWVVLHSDDGDKVFEYSASNQADVPVLTSSGSLVAHSFMVDMPDPTGSLSAEDQELDENRKLNINSVVNSHPGWVVVYHDAEEGPDLNVRLSVPRHTEAGTHTDLKVDLEDDVDIQNNQLLWVVLHSDDGDKVFEFSPEDDLDLPVLTESDEIVMDSFRVSFSWPTGSIRVSLPIIEEDRKLLISSVEMNSKGWLVLHGDSNWEPLLTEIIAEPKLLEAGSYQDIELTLNEDVEMIYGKNIWAALYTDDGDNIYEFDGSGETDTAFLNQDGSPVAERFTAYKASSLKYFFLMIAHQGITAWLNFENDPGWLLLYRDNGLGAPSMSEPVSKPIYVTTEDGFYRISFESGVEISNQEILWLVFHSDDGDGTFEYVDNNDIDPPAKDEDGEFIRVPFRPNELSIF